MPFLAPLAGAALPALIGTGVNLGAQALFGGNNNPTASLTNFQPSGINAGGLTSTFNNGQIGISPSADRTGLVGQLAATSGLQADEFGRLRGMVNPGFSELARVRLGELNDRATSAIGDLRQNLARRRVLGSSFAQDSLTRANSEFAKQADQIKADSFLRSLEANVQLTQQEFTARRQQFSTGLDELNLEANLAAGLAGKATDILGRNAQIEAMLNAQSQQLAGQFFGQTFAPVGRAIGGAVGGLFGSPGGSTTFGTGGER